MAAKKGSRTSTANAQNDDEMEDELYLLRQRVRLLESRVQELEKEFEKSKQQMPANTCIQQRVLQDVFEQFSKQLAEVLQSRMWSELEPEFQKSLADSVQENLGLHGYPAASNKQINKRVKVTLLITPKRAGRHHKPVPISRLCAQWSKGPMRLTSNHKSSSVQTAVSLARERLLSKACQTLTSSGLAPDNNTTWNLLVSKHPKGTPPTPPSAPLLAAPHLPPDFNIMAVLHSFPKDTACGPSGLRIQHLIEAAEVPLPFPICAVLREVVNMLISGKVPVQVARFLAGGNLVALEKNKPNCPTDIRPIAVGEAIRRLVGKCLCSMTKAITHDFLAPFQLGVACQGGAEKIIHGLRSCVDEHWHEVDFEVLKIDLHNAFNRVSRQAVLNACALHIPELLPWSQWCYGQHPALWHSLGTISSEIGVQQGDPLGPLLFCLVLQQIISAIAEDVDCESLLFHHWYIDDGVVAGPVAAIARVLAIIQESGPPLGLNINIAKCELFSSRDLSSFPEEMRRSNVPHFEILGAPIGDLVFCAKFVAQKQSEASKLLKELEAVGSIDPQVALLLLRQCGSFCRLVHLARNTPPLLVNEAFALFDDCVQQCFSECTAVDASAATWQQAQLSLKRGGLGLQSLSFHSPAACIASFLSSGLSPSSGRYISSSLHLYNSLVDPQDSITHESVGDSPLSQKVLSSKIEDQQFNNLFHNASVTDRARLLYISSPHASAWPSVTPSPRLNLHLEPAEFQVALKWCALLEASVTAGSAALLAENRKHNNSDKKCDKLGWACIPLVVETYGCWGAEAVAALSKLAGRLSVRNNEPKSKTIFSLYSRLGLTLIRANCRAILSRLT
eukprot:Em0007g1259a